MIFYFDYLTSANQLPDNWEETNRTVVADNINLFRVKVIINNDEDAIQATKKIFNEFALNVNQIKEACSAYYIGELVNIPENISGDVYREAVGNDWQFE